MYTTVESGWTSNTRLAIVAPGTKFRAGVNVGVDVSAEQLSRRSMLLAAPDRVRRDVSALGLELASPAGG